MRNSKVRRRIAAGKLRLRIRDLRNLGPRSEALLERIGVRSVESLRQRGAIESYLALRRVGATRSLNMLWAMAGALDPWPEGRDWRDVASGEQRLALLLAVESAGGAGLASPRADGEGRARRRKGAVARAGAGDALGAWAPGLPFDEAEEGGLPPQGAAPSDQPPDASADPVAGTRRGRRPARPRG